MQYLLLIYEAESDLINMPQPAKQAIWGEYMQFSKAIADSGHMRGGNALQPIASATTVRVKEGKTLTTAGPFAETREQLGGYYLIEANDLDDAIAVAARIPAARSGSIEIRPVMEIHPAK